MFASQCHPTVSPVAPLQPSLPKHEPAQSEGHHSLLRNPTVPRPRLRATAWVAPVLAVQALRGSMHRIVALPPHAHVQKLPDASTQRSPRPRSGPALPRSAPPKAAEPRGKGSPEDALLAAHADSCVPAGPTSGLLPHTSSAAAHARSTNNAAARLRCVLRALSSHMHAPSRAPHATLARLLGPWQAPSPRAYRRGSTEAWADAACAAAAGAAREAAGGVSVTSANPTAASGGASLCLVEACSSLACLLHTRAVLKRFDACKLGLIGLIGPGQSERWTTNYSSDSIIWTAISRRLEYSDQTRRAQTSSSGSAPYEFDSLVNLKP